MDSARRPVSPFSSLFAGSEAATVIDFLLSRDEHQTTAEIHAGTLASMNRVSKIIERLLDIDVLGIGARRQGNKRSMVSFEASVGNRTI